MPRQGGLGRGLASLIPQKKTKVSDKNYFGQDPEGTEPKMEKSSLPVPEAEVLPPATVPGQTVHTTPFQLETAASDSGVLEAEVGLIAANPFQPRKNFDQQKLEELAESIKNYGVIQPLVVTKKKDGGYELIAGERRLEASKLAGKKTVPVLVREVNDQEKLEMALIENIQRHDLDVIEEARSYKELQDLFSLTQEEIAQRVGKSRSAVANIMRLLNLPIEIQKAIQQNKITEGHARSILAVTNPEKQRALFELILKQNLTVRQVEEKVKEIMVASHKRTSAAVDPDLKEKENKLASLLGTKVKIKSTSKGGQLVIEYFSPDELSAIINRLTKPEDEV